MPRGLSQNYEPQILIKPGSPILVLKNEGKTQTSIMLWGFISEWSKDPFDNTRPKPFNARSESVAEKKLFRASWRHRRCLIPASGFLEKGHLIGRKDSQTFWIGGLWNRWMSKNGCLRPSARGTWRSCVHSVRDSGSMPVSRLLWSESTYG